MFNLDNAERLRKLQSRRFRRPNTWGFIYVPNIHRWVGLHLEAPRKMLSFVCPRSDICAVVRRFTRALSNAVSRFEDSSLRKSVPCAWTNCRMRGSNRKHIRESTSAVEPSSAQTAALRSQHEIYAFAGMSWSIVICELDVSMLLRCQKERPLGTTGGRVHQTR